MRTPLLFDTFSEEAQLAKPTRAFQARERFLSGTKPIGLVFLPLLESPSRYWYLQLCKNQPWLDPPLIMFLEWCRGTPQLLFSRHSQNLPGFTQPTVALRHCSGPRIGVNCASTSYQCSTRLFCGS